MENKIYQTLQCKEYVKNNDSLLNIIKILKDFFSKISKLTKENLEELFLQIENLREKELEEEKNCYNCIHNYSYINKQYCNNFFKKNNL